jgi:RNA polymerase sigma factor (sigma-70 family)
MKLLNLFKKSPTSEQDTLYGCRQNDPKAQRQLYEQYAPMMLGVCHRYVKRMEIAEEMLSNGFIKVFKNINYYEGRGSFEGWIRKIMVRECLDYIKVQKGIWISIEDTPYLPDNHTDSTDVNLNVGDLLGLIDTLPAGYRTVFNLYAIEGYKHQEIGEMLGISENTSKTQLMKAREALQGKYYELYDIPQPMSKRGVQANANFKK